MKIITDNRWKNFKDRSELPKKMQKTEDIDYETGFLCYRGIWFHQHDFVRCDHELRDLGWDGFYSGSVFDGVVIRVHKNNEQYKIGRFYS